MNSRGDANGLYEKCIAWNGDAAMFANIVSEAIDTLGINRSDLAEEFQVAATTVARWAAGISIPFPGFQRVVVKSIAQHTNKAVSTNHMDLKMNNQVFGWAIEQLHRGKRVQRAGWNGKGMFLFLINERSFDAEPMPEFATGLEVMSFIAMKTADNKIVPWLASQTDVLASDWSVVG